MRMSDSQDTQTYPNSAPHHRDTDGGGLKNPSKKARLASTAVDESERMCPLCHTCELQCLPEFDLEQASLTMVNRKIAKPE